MSFHLLELTLSALIFIFISPFLGFILKFFVVVAGPIVLRGILNYCVTRRFSKFDADFPQFLLSVVGLLKTGMAPLNAMEAAAQGLDNRSLVRREVGLLIERMRLGAAEERSIGAFGETIYHPEIELFIQALLLSRRVGGGLSDTLERLAKQIRKRQYFRNSANASVALQRASMWLILGILAFVEIYIYMTYPILVTESWSDSSGWLIWQGAIVATVVAIIWSREVTNIRV